MKKERYERVGHVLIIRPEGDLDHHVAEDIRIQADRLIDLYQIDHLVFDFSDTEFMDSSGIGVIIGRYKRVMYAGGTVSVIRMGERVEKIFRMSGLGRIVRQYQSMDELLERGKR